jgi:hypothetical protein
VLIHRSTITPIRVTHEFQLQVFYSVDGESVAGRPIKGPGELRMMAVKMPITLPSVRLRAAASMGKGSSVLLMPLQCCCVASTLTLPTCECCRAPSHRAPLCQTPPIAAEI